MESVDFYKYPGEDVLINFFDCHDAEELALLEALSTGANLLYLQMHPINGTFDFKHLKDIHYFIFQDIYDWAGQVRKVDISKNSLFCRAQFIDDHVAMYLILQVRLIKKCLTQAFCHLIKATIPVWYLYSIDALFPLKNIVIFKSSYLPNFFNII